MCVGGECEAEGPQCAGDGDCDPGFVCREGACLLDAGDCAGDGDCPDPLTQSCDGGACVADPCAVQTFVFRPAPGEQPGSVHVAGTFNDWAPTAADGGWALQPLDDGALWFAKRSLADGIYEYKLVIDEERWITDPDNPDRTSDGFEGFNSVLTVDCGGGGEGCVVDGDCLDPLTQTCAAGGTCVDNPCRLQAFTFNPRGQAYRSVHVAGTFNGWPGTVADGGLAMRLLPDRGLWYAKLELGDGQYEYKYVLDETAWIADPDNPEGAPDGVGGSNSVRWVACQGGGVCGDVDAFDWRDPLLYFVMVDRFHDSDGRSDPVPDAQGGDPRWAPSGQYAGGDLPGVTAKLPYLRDLGVTAIWLSAPYDNRDWAGGSVNPAADGHLYSGYHGYWPSPDNVDYSDPLDPQPRPRVESRIGSEADLRGVIDGAHGLQGADGHGMKVLVDYVMNHVDIASGLYEAHPDWFARRDGAFALCQPEDLWDDPFWGTRCAFTDYLPPFDFDNAAARAWSVDDALWWAREFGFDGYRLDAIKHVPFRWLTDLRARLNDVVPDPEGERFYLVGETFAYDDPGLLRNYVNPDTMLDGQFDFPFKARLCEALFTRSMGLDDFAGWMDGNDGFYGPRAIMSTWIGNHDVPRAIHFAAGQIGNCRQGSEPGNSWTGDYHQPGGAAPYERLGLAFAVMLTNNGVPLIYYGDEVGLAGGGDPDNRRMMPWNDDELNPHQHALRATVTRLARIRAENKVLSRGRRQTLSANGDVWLYRRSGCGDGAPDVIVGINRGDGERQVQIPAGDYEDLMRDVPAVGGQATIPARGVLVWRVAP